MKLIVTYRQRNHGLLKIPWWYGVSYQLPQLAVYVYYPYPINWIIRYTKELFWYSINLLWWIGLIDVMVGEEFYWGAFYRLKVKK
jgi:hypothetical protein